MDKWLLLVGTNSSDPEKEKEFNDWYDKIHIPDVLETPGFIGATRWENPSPQEGEAKFLAFYEIETDDIDAFMKTNAENLARKREEGRFTDLLV
ncbi:DUF4286 family protein, partial [Chloroflexota bacterium]